MSVWLILVWATAAWGCAWVANTPSGVVLILLGAAMLSGL